MRVTVLGGGGAWPVAGQGCSGYLVSTGRTLLLLDPGPGTLGELLTRHDPHEVSAALISHGHADHTVDLAALLRARRMTRRSAVPLPVYAPTGALDAVLSLDVPEVVAPSVAAHPVGDGENATIGGVHVGWRSLPHHVANLGMRLRADGVDLVFTGDTGCSTDLVAFAEGADMLLADATYSQDVPEEDSGLLGSAVEAGRTARRAGVGHLVLTHLWPGTDPVVARTQAATEFPGPIDVAHPGWEAEVAAGAR